MGFLSSLFGKKETAEVKQAKLEKKNFEILKYDGMRARNMRKSEYAIKCFEEALALKEDAEIYAMLASTYMQTGKTLEARETLEKLIGKEPENTNALISLAGLCFLMEDYKSMLGYSNKAIETDGNNATALYLAGKANKNMSRGIEAIVNLSKAIAQKEDFIEAYQLRAETLLSMGQDGEAMKDTEQILSIDENNEDALILKSELLIKEKKEEEARKILKTICELNPFNNKAYILKANIMVERDDYDGAIRIYDSAIEMMESDAVLYEERGRIKLLKGDKDGSMEDMKKAMELNPEKMEEVNEKFAGIKTNSGTSIY